MCSISNGTRHTKGVMGFPSVSLSAGKSVEKNGSTELMFSHSTSALALKNARLTLAQEAN
jgi:hypothetical protein